MLGEATQPLHLRAVMPGLVPGIHALFLVLRTKDVDGRVKPGQDEESTPSPNRPSRFAVAIVSIAATSAFAIKIVFVFGGIRVG